MAEYVPSRLLATLENLNTKELERFHWQLSNGNLKHFPHISKAHLENANRHDTVDRMVNTYGDNGAFAVTSIILKNNEQNKLARNLERDAEKELAQKTNHLDCTLEEFGDRGEEREEGKLVSELKDKLKSDLTLLEDKLEKCENVRESYDSMTQHTKDQQVDTKRRIREEFEKLHQFLREEEEARLAALREEEEVKAMIIERGMESLEEQIFSLTNVIEAVKEDLKKGCEQFLVSYKDTQSSARAHCELPDPQLVSGALIDMAKHLGNLQFQVWEQMRGIVKHSPVILDPNTAPSTMALSDDLTSVRHTAIEQQKVPDNPERFTRWAKVLGSVGFAKGSKTHSWEVEVGEQPEWNLGVAADFVNRKGEDLLASPEYGIWALLKRRHEYTNGMGKKLTLRRRPQRIRVQLNYERGEVAFYDPKDNTHIYTHKHRFTERVYPYISVWKIKDAINCDIQICQSEVSVTVKSYQ
ncbi:E3 ubiquitin-protein ligase TRIM35-like [Coregonus clupeaformis]|uniref:E3 ubiquitin-protein ligase TRIM35-like n=1 Tax=Coregonus clupeaformis TaxID=59861 RepID=UPI001BE0B7D5|nr:E3 ubiquitin-protein ligase TRIM35-like [Coregonus clupeaformis]